MGRLRFEDIKIGLRIINRNGSWASLPNGTSCVVLDLKSSLRNCLIIKRLDTNEEVHLHKDNLIYFEKKGTNFVRSRTNVPVQRK